MKFKRGILLAATANSAFTLGTMMINLLEIMPKKIDIFYILCDDLSPKDKQIMLNLAAGGGALR
ncbi:hypothetical protein DMB95_01285 [Campylobacter sp. MIT 12-8780]|uniref:hypothetical protein n=1 Tax=unclassified Campylobacter TaxID=2593542 RepID=UPI00115EFE81|nr:MULTISPECIES: hypothetical protein [unclassified Campylobacter]NDJ26594.1 hypothetical protein [Campylobacter sp. MIT 19-121]TQR43160.1 hypothetical protein DMB95_01285 [Campylobacter sp. MIT 12-8780]